MADVGRGENGVTTNSIDHSGEDKDKHPLNSCFLETEGNSLRSVDAKDDMDETKAAQKYPVIVAPGGIEMDIQETVCSSSQEKMQDGPVEQVSKSLPQTASFGKDFSPDSVAAKGEDDLDVTEPSCANAQIQEAEIETRAELGFDLNEELFSEDLNSAVVPNQELNCDDVDRQVINQTSMATSVISASRPAASSGLPAGRLQFEGTLGWKGSAATSAFRPAYPHIPLESNNFSNSLEERQNVHGFDLNMVDDRNADNIPDSVVAVSSSHPSDESCVEIGPSKWKGADLDLNCFGDAPPPAFWSVNPLSHQSAYRSPSPASSSSSVHPAMWSLDLNKKFSVPNFPHDQPPYPGNSTIHFVESHVIKKPTASEFSILGTRVDVGRDEPFLRSQLYPTGNIPGFKNFLPPSSSHPSLSINPNPTQQLQSFMYRPGIPVTMFGPRDSSIMAAPPPPPQGIVSPSFTSFDQNMLYMNDAPNRTEPHTRQYLMSTQGGFLEPHSTPIPQPSSFLTKRKEPHSGWDPYNHKPL